jgi:hypothetical protein
MSDGAFLLVASVVAAVFVIAVLVTNPNPERRNPHKDAERPRWHTRTRS